MSDHRLVTLPVSGLRHPAIGLQVFDDDRTIHIPARHIVSVLPRNDDDTRTTVTTVDGAVYWVDTPLHLVEQYVMFGDRSPFL